MFDVYMPDSRTTPKLSLDDRLLGYLLQGVSRKTISSNVETASEHSFVTKNQVIVAV